MRTFSLGAAIVGLALCATACDRDGKQPVEPPAAAEPTGPEAKADATERDYREVRVKADGQLGPGSGTILIALEAPEGGKLTDGTPLVVEAKGLGMGLDFPERLKKPLKTSELPLRIPVKVTDGAMGPAEIRLKYYWCSTGDDGACTPEKVRMRVDLDLSGSGAGGEAYFTHRPKV